MKRLLGVIAILLVAAAAGVYFAKSGTPLTTLPGPNDTVTVPIPEPAPTPFEPTTRPAPEPGRLKHWGACATKGHADGRPWKPSDYGFGRVRFEDASLRAVLASTVEDSPLFGIPEIGMQGANCAAKRERLAWMR